MRRIVPAVTFVQEFHPFGLGVLLLPIQPLHPISAVTNNFTSELRVPQGIRSAINLATLELGDPATGLRQQFLNGHRKVLVLQHRLRADDPEMAEGRESDLVSTVVLRDSDHGWQLPPDAAYLEGELNWWQEVPMWLLSADHLVLAHGFYYPLFNAFSAVFYDGAADMGFYSTDVRDHRGEILKATPVLRIAGEIKRQNSMGLHRAMPCEERPCWQP